MQNAGLDYFQRRQAWRAGMGLRLRLLERWAQSHPLLGPATADRLAGILERLDQDTLSIAFVGEISRGKSELINAIFFGESTHRVLPAGPGRTTLCPTEIRFHPQLAPSLQLLPLASAAEPPALTAAQDAPDAWVHVNLAQGDAQQVSETLQRITWTQEQDVAVTRAAPEGPQAASLPHAAVARWGHAIVNLAHPLLARGLRILDMPGLNAVAAEPQRALGLLAQCDVLVFLLSADTGLTASELALWHGHLAQGEGADCESLVVLNKTDSLWDAQQDATAVDQQLRHMRMDVAAALGVVPARVVSLSAREALAAQVAGDAARLARSDLSTLEHALWKNILVDRHQRCQARLAHELALCKADMEHALLARAQDLGSPKELRRVQVTESIVMNLMEKIRRALQMPELDTTMANLHRNLNQSMGLPSVRHAYAQAQKDIHDQWRQVEQWAGEMGHMLSASETEASRESASPHKPSGTLKLAPYLELLQQAFDGQLQFLGNSQVHRLKQADFTAKLVSAGRARVAEISHRISQDCEAWHAEATQTLGHRRQPSETSADRINHMQQTLNAHFLALEEANAYD